MHAATKAKRQLRELGLQLDEQGMPMKANIKLREVSPPHLGNTVKSDRLAGEDRCWMRRWLQNR